MKNALQEQIGGSHYKGRALQPLVLSYAIANGDSCFTKLLKYITREKGNRLEDLQKAMHICRLADSLIDPPSLAGRIHCPKAAKAMISAFAKQFERAELIEKVAEEFFVGDYKRAESLLYEEELIEKHK